MTIEELIDFKMSDFVPYYGKKNYISRTQGFLNSDTQKIIEDKLDTLGLLEGCYMVMGGGIGFVLLKLYFPLN